MSADTLSSTLAKQPPEVSLIGPFLSSHRPGHIRICLGLPGSATRAGRKQKKIRTLRCTLLLDGQTLGGASAAPRHPVYRTFVFDFENLPAGAVLQYRFSSEGRDLELEGGLEPGDCRFRIHGPWSEADSLVLCSCHNPYELAGYEQKTRLRLKMHGIMAWFAQTFNQTPPVLPDNLGRPRWGMWTRLMNLEEEDPSLRLLVLGGDQVYNDDVETEFLGKLAPPRPDKAFVDDLRARFIRQYQLYWQHPDYRKVLARLPSVAMWDDHDITDGWGGREKSFQGFKGTEFAPRWRLYFKVAQEVFAHYQAVRNPDPLAGLPPDAQSTRLDLEPLGSLVLADLRSEKNSRLRQLVSPGHETVLHDTLRAGPGRRLLLLVPVVPVRTNIHDDERLVGLFKVWLLLQTLLEKYPLIPYAIDWMTSKLLFTAVIALAALVAWGETWQDRAVFLGTGLVLGFAFLLAQACITAFNSQALPELTDDLEDGLSAKQNLPVLNRLLESLFSWQRQAPGRQAAILTGDIHTLGLSEILEERAEGGVQSIPQIVSSPMAYYPMPKPVEGFTTTTSEIGLYQDASVRRYARNITYISKRNFCQLFPGRLAAPEPGASHQGRKGHEETSLQTSNPDRMGTHRDPDNKNVGFPHQDLNLNTPASGRPIRFHLDGHSRPLEFPAKFTNGL